MGLNSLNACPRPPRAAVLALRRTQTRPSRNMLVVSVASQRLSLFELSTRQHNSRRPLYDFRRRYIISTSIFGAGQVQDSQQTPLGLHRIAQKIGAGLPIGTVFKSRQVVGLTWNGQPDGTIVHRILWLEWCGPGLNSGGKGHSF